MKFDNLEYQSEAVNSIVNIFEGQKINKANFTVSNYFFSSGTGNYLDLLDDQILENVRKIQLDNKLTRSVDLQDMNFSIEMETGTGKTYVYIKTILELNKKYGFTKFVIVVPSIAIKEGVLKSFELTKEHFENMYDNVNYTPFVYDAKSVGTQVHNFATSNDIQIMILTISSFISDWGDKNEKSNILNRRMEEGVIAGEVPMDLIRRTNPIVIIDEPQSVDNTPKSKEAIRSLNPLCTLRYSATHRNKYNLMYKLDAVDAYNQKLVKQISVNSEAIDTDGNTPYIKLISVSDKGGYSAKLHVNIKNKNGSISQSNITLKVGDELKDYTGLDYYDNYILDDIDTTEGEEYIQFTNTDIIKLGESIGSVDETSIKRAQIRATIDTHLKRERIYTKADIKVLSLFFIDEVKKYRDYDAEDKKGEYYRIFEEEYTNLINGKYRDLKENNPSYYDLEKVHDGYFSVDGKGNIKNTKGDSSADESTYSKIMKNKERLLNFKEPLRFIFSHSALKEGWDNPNVFQVCTLVETKDNMTRRQKIGRGLRICVNQEGKRVYNEEYNQLTVIPNESYKNFAQGLQNEIEKETGVKFGSIEREHFASITVKGDNGEYNEIGIDESTRIFKYLIEKEVITSSGKITEKGKSDIRYKNIDIPDEFSKIKDEIYSKLEEVNTKLPIRNVNQEVSVKLNKRVYLSDEFKALWDKIKSKTIYSVQMDVDAFVSACVNDINNMDDIKKFKIRSETVKLDINKSGIETNNYMRRDIGEIDIKLNYPDPLRYIQDETHLTRKTAYKIITESNKFTGFLNNPQRYLQEVCKIIEKNKRKQLIDGIQYKKVHTCYEQSLFENNELKAYLENNAIESKKGVFDHVVYDSDIEKDFAINMENDEDCKLFVKLPNWFTVDTPLGKHNPDWAIIMNKDNEEKLYFVVETKGTRNEEERRGTENGKITCARKHFEALNTNVEYKTSAGYYNDFKI